MAKRISGPKYEMSQNRPDSFGTPAYALEPLVKYIPKKFTLWECAAGEGMMVDGLKSLGYTKIIASSIEEKTRKDIRPLSDFLIYSPKADAYDMIITNPPFTQKYQFLERCYELNKPFALLMPITALEGQKRQKLYRKKGIQLIMPPGRINFTTPIKKLEEGKGSSAWFYSCWYSFGLNLPNDIIFETEWSK